MNRDELENLLAPQPGWNPLQPPKELKTHRRFLADGEGDRVMVRYYQRAHEHPIVARVYYGPKAEGPPGHAHGGSIASVLDESMGAAVWTSQHLGVAAEITVRYLQLLPLEQVYQVEAWVKAIDGRKVLARAKLVSLPSDHEENGTLFAQARSVFVDLDPQKVQLFFQSLKGK